MFDVASSLTGALQTSGSRLGDAASRTALAQTPYGSSRSDAPMAAVARQTIFTEVLLNAVHARLAEIKTAAAGR